MSLDVYLTLPGAAPAEQGSGIFVREGGRTREVARAEWDRTHPGREPYVCKYSGEPGRAYHGNVTHNLGRMARAAGVYMPLWRPEECGITKARELVAPLSAGLAALESNLAGYRALNPENGWGTYEGLVAFVREYLEACRRWPDAEVSVWR